MRFLIVFLICLNLNAISQNEIVDLYENEEYDKICQPNVVELFSKSKDEYIANLYAKSCLKTDKINRLTTAIIELFRTKKSRENSAFLTTILFQKKLLYHAVIDNVDISYIRLPKIDYPLSKVFHKFVSKDYQKRDNVFIFKDDDKIYELFVRDSGGIKKLILNTLKDDIIIDSKSFW